MLSAFPPRARARLLHLGRPVIGKARQSVPTKGHTAKLSRQDCFLRFCHENDAEDPTAKDIPTKQSNFLLACHAVNVTAGDNILGLNLRSGTVRPCLNAAAELCTDRKLDNPFCNKRLEENFANVTVNALSKCEKVPQRQEVVTDEMFDHIATLALDAPPDGLVAALHNWLAWSRHGGPHRAEWCQTAKTKHQKVTADSVEEQAQAFVADDMTCHDNVG